jgi:hypothetical protein
MKDSKEIVNFKIKPGIGIGDIYLKQNVADIIDKYANYQAYYVDKILKVRAVYPDVFIYRFIDSVELYIDIKTSLLVRINMTNGFKGKYKDIIGIGDKILKLKEIEKNLSYDDDQVFVGNDYGLIMVADNDLMSLEDEEIDNCRIESMIIRV